jgi:hypothetical protein
MMRAMLYEAAQILLVRSKKQTFCAAVKRRYWITSSGYEALRTALFICIV